ncbi:MAG: hypothetical protein R6U11_10070 [Bacteroidales bacterium]
MKALFNNIIIVGIIISFSFAFLACDKDEDLSPLPEQIKFSLSEKFHKDSSQVILKAQSIEEYSCLNFEIIFSRNYNGGTNVIKFKGITNHGYCAAAIGPAKSNIYICNGLENGIYNYEFISDDDHDFFEFTVAEDFVKLNHLGSASGRIIYEHEKMFRLEKNTIWGYTSAAESGYKSHEDFIADLEKLNIEFLDLQDGYYGFFAVEDGEISFFDDEATRIDNSIPFIFTYESSLSEICEIVSLHSDKLDIFIRSTEGEFCDEE